MRKASLAAACFVILGAALWATQLIAHSEPPALGPAVVIDSGQHSSIPRTSSPPSQPPAPSSTGTDGGAAGGADPVAPPSPPEAGDDDYDDYDEDDDYDDDDEP